LDINRKYRYAIIKHKYSKKKNRVSKTEMLKILLCSIMHIHEHLIKVTINSSNTPISDNNYKILRILYAILFVKFVCDFTAE